MFLSRFAPDPTERNIDGLASALGLQAETWARLRTDATRTGCHPIDLALCEGRISETDLIARLADWLGCSTASIPPVPQPLASPWEAYFRRGYRAGPPEAELQVIAPNGMIAAMLLEKHELGNLPAILLTTEQALLDALVLAHQDLLATRAAGLLAPDLSSRHIRAWPLLTMAGLVLSSVAVLVLPSVPLLSVGAGLLLVMLGVTIILATISTMTAACLSLQPERKPPALPDEALPAYTLLVPLFREEGMVIRLVHRLQLLVYPAPKRQVLLLLEADDLETRRALANLHLPHGFLVLPVPPGMPRTKPRALNHGLAFARGGLLTVYDAEDMPEPQQLRLAAEAFAAAGPRAGCLQARLAIANHADGWLTQRFAQDYAALFDCTKRGFALAGWPVALGGSSNHFRTVTLRDLGGWDACNVTEDADLGYRLALRGYHVVDLPSTTWEEAPNRIRIWRNQRIRWLKGWYQTILVHGRHLPAYSRTLDPLALVALTCLPVALLVSALFLPLFAGLGLWRLLSPLPWCGNPAGQVVLDSMMLLVMTFSAGAEILPVAFALGRRGWLRRLGWLTLSPLTHLLIFACAWSALYELLTRPHFWRKTPHGLSARALAWVAPDQKQSARKPAIISPKTVSPWRHQSRPPHARKRPATRT